MKLRSELGEHEMTLVLRVAIRQFFLEVDQSFGRFFVVVKRRVYVEMWNARERKRRFWKHIGPGPSPRHPV